MNNSNRKRRNVVLGADLLESRALLNAHLPQSPIMHVTSLHAEASAPKPITGKLNTQLLFGPPNPMNPATEDINFSGSGTSTVGSAHLTALAEEQNQRPTVVSRTVFLHTDQNCEWDRDPDAGQRLHLALNFSGSLHEWHALEIASHRNLHSPTRSATVQSGPNQGQVETFKATGSAPNNKFAMTLHFTLK